MGEKQNVPDGTVDSLVAHYCVESLRPHANQTEKHRIAEPFSTGQQRGTAYD
ncbi:hypothetical protein ACUXLG_005884 [Ralstonia sp. 121560039-2]|jgi:hypothetical protein